MSKPAYNEAKVPTALGDIELAVRATVARVLERTVEDILPHSDLESELGLDSLGMIQVGVAIEEQFDVVILAAESPEFTLHTVADLTTFIANTSRTIKSEQEDGHATNASR